MALPMTRQSPIRENGREQGYIHGNLYLSRKSLRGPSSGTATATAPLELLMCFLSVMEEHLETCRCVVAM